MSSPFITIKALSRATGRAKSDVANKLVSMFLHEVSRKACAAGGLLVSDPAYTAQVAEAFPGCCVYCSRELEQDRAAVEHLDGMNRFRAGLHVPGNVAVACRRCNNEKRREDQRPQLVLAASGWESFLATMDPPASQDALLANTGRASGRIPIPAGSGSTGGSGLSANSAGLFSAFKTGPGCSLHSSNRE